MQPAVGQFSVPGLLGGAKDVAVKQALSTFGQSIGDQLPIQVADGDRYPTVDALPGSPFKTSAATANVAALLRTSTDGTIELKAGDYEFPVSVFCMRAYAHSPSAFHYVVAPLKGSAADIIQALNSRIPSLSLNHGAVQLLSWNIQAGLPYDAMQPAQRAIVDRVIPEYRPRLNGDVYESIRAKYTSVSSRVPGMPGFEDALSRIGTIGQSVIEMERLRQQLAQPPMSFAQLAQALVPISLPAGLATPQGPTPWSRYSNRVYVRFVTAGNYATPGSYQVRVLPQAVSIASTSHLALGRLADSSTASVPVTNIVNNPGTGSVQPLTQTPSGGGGNQPEPTPAPTPSPRPNITSETVAESPPDRARTVIGVGEQVTLTFSGDDAHWAISSGLGKLSSSSGKTTILIASDDKSSGTITATDTTTHAVATISFTVIRPSGIFTEEVPGTLIHTQGKPNSGFQLNIYLLPDTVSFEFLEFREHEVKSHATGIYSFENNMPHGALRDFTPVLADVPGKGSPVSPPPDEAYSGYPNKPPPYAPGYVSWDIPLYYEVIGHTNEINFGHVLQIHTLEKDGQTLTTTKGNATDHTTVGSPTSN